VVRLGLPRRGSGNPKQWLTLDDYRAIQLRNAMAVTAKAEQAAMKAMQQEGSYRRPGQDRSAA
jgi:hypothetical protein